MRNLWGSVDRWWGLGLGLSRCELRECPVWPRGIEMALSTWAAAVAGMIGGLVG